MALKIYKRPSGIYHLRGVHHGARVDESTKTRRRDEAEGIKEKREREIFEDVVLKRPRQRSFAEAAISYMKAGGEARYLETILAATITVDGRVMRFGEVPLDDIDEDLIVALAESLKPNAKGSTRKRSIFVPINSVLRRASRIKKFNYGGIVVVGPGVEKGSPDWKLPAEIEWWLARCAHLRPLITAYVGTGARASELTSLEWRNVSPENYTVTLWEEDTKAETARTLELQKRVRDCWPQREGTRHVFLNSHGTPWSDTRSINTFLSRITEREARSLADRADHEELKSLKRLCRTQPSDLRPTAAFKELLKRVVREKNVPELHLHSLRHTWATWAYAVTRDITWVKQMGGWASADLVHRYMHSGSRDLGSSVLDHGWLMYGDQVSSVGTLGRKRGGE